MLKKFEPSCLDAPIGETVSAAALSPQEIQTINVYGPYNHGAWTGRGVTITHEESITGRADFIAARIRGAIAAAFTPAEIEELSIVDVGCYDGWILERLSDLPFKRMCGIEPRARNIEKGEKIREILGLESRVEYKVGALENLGEERFDVVLCCGLLHHVEAVGAALDRLRAICNKMIFIETQCLQSEFITDGLVRQIEPKDVAYLNRSHTVGLVGHKFESSYYHGSAMKSGVVSVPTPSAVQMFLERAGFERSTVLVQPSSYWDGPVKRAAKGCCITAWIGELRPEVELAEAVERDALETALPEEVIRQLHGVVCEGKALPLSAARARLVAWYVAAPSWLSAILLKMICWAWPAPRQRELVRSLRYAPRDKIELELAKLQFKCGDYRACFDAASRITTRLNADWRSVYRAFVLMACAARQLGDQEGTRKYREMALMSNEELPLSLFDELTIRTGTAGEVAS